MLREYRLARAGETVHILARSLWEAVEAAQDWCDWPDADGMVVDVRAGASWVPAVEVES